MKRIEITVIDASEKGLIPISKREVSSGWLRKHTFYAFSRERVTLKITGEPNKEVLYSIDTVQFYTPPTPGWFMSISGSVKLNEKGEGTLTITTPSGTYIGGGDFLRFIKFRYKDVHEELKERHERHEPVDPKEYYPDLGDNEIVICNGCHRVSFKIVVDKYERKEGNHYLEGHLDTYLEGKYFPPENVCKWFPLPYEYFEGKADSTKLRFVLDRKVGYKWWTLYPYIPADKKEVTIEVNFKGRISRNTTLAPCTVRSVYKIPYKPPPPPPLKLEWVRVAGIKAYYIFDTKELDVTVSLEYAYSGKVGEEKTVTLVFKVGDKKVGTGTITLPKDKASIGKEFVFKNLELNPDVDKEIVVEVYYGDKLMDKSSAGILYSPSPKPVGFLNITVKWSDGEVIEGASVYVDDTLVGKTDERGALEHIKVTANDPHTVYAVKDSKKSDEKTVVVEPGQEKNVTLFIYRPSTGKIKVYVLNEYSHPIKDASVYVDGSYVGETNDEGYLEVVVKSGMHEVYAVYKGKKSDVEKVYVPIAQEITVKLVIVLSTPAPPVPPGKEAYLTVVVKWDNGKPVKDATVYVDNKIVGYTNESGVLKDIIVEEGEHQVYATKDSLTSSVKEVTLKHGERKTVELTITRSIYGFLDIYVYDKNGMPIKDALVFVDDTNVGATDERGNIRVKVFADVPHTVYAIYDVYSSKKIKVKVERGETKTVELTIPIEKVKISVKELKLSVDKSEGYVGDTFNFTITITLSRPPLNDIPISLSIFVNNERYAILPGVIIPKHVATRIVPYQWKAEKEGEYEFFVMAGSVKSNTIHIRVKRKEKVKVEVPKWKVLILSLLALIPLGGVIYYELLKKKE